MVDFASIIKEQREELDAIMTQEHIIIRDALADARKYLEHPNILVITGIRRCGKSILSYLLERNEKFAYINFDDERLANITAVDLDAVLGAAYALHGQVDYLILDEIQNIKGWELFVTRLQRTKRIIVTGSNANLLSSELSTHLTGRHIDITLFPFSFKEYLTYRNFKVSQTYTTKEKAEIIVLLEEYMQQGGMPEAYKFGRRYLAGVYDDILTKDIIIRYGITKSAELKNLSKYLISNPGGEVSYSNLKGPLNIGHVSTISNWVSYLEAAFLFFKIERFDFKLKKQYLSNKKFYCIDTGLINSIGFIFSENKGKLMENIVAIELQRRKIRDAAEVYYWKDTYDKEVDFIIKKGKKITELLQVTYANTKQDIKEREIDSLAKAEKELKTTSKTIITWDYEGREGSILYIPLWKWLLSQEK